MIDFILIPEERMKILKRDKNWEKDLKKYFNVKVSLDEDIEIEGKDPFAVVRTKEIFKAFGRGFKFETALDLVDEEYFLDTIEVKDYAGKSKKRQVVLKGRVIGSEGKMKKIIEKYADVKVVIYGKTVSIIGKWGNVRKAKVAVEKLLAGSKHSGVTAFLKRLRE